MSKKLHLGCGTRIIPGFINVDIRQVHPEIHVDNVATLETIEDRSVELIYASHVLEHFGRYEVEKVLHCWLSKLCKGGILRLSVPNLRKVASLYLSGEYSAEQMYGFLYGGQMHDFDFHKIIFDYESLERILKQVGFSECRLWDWHITEHASYDDYSQAYLPHMEKDTGTMMSVNLEAIK